MEKRKLLIVINQFFKGGAETALVNLLGVLSKDAYEIDLLIFDQINLKESISLIPQIPSWVRVVNVAEHEKRAAFIKKAAFKVYRRLSGEQLFRKSAKVYLHGRYYDAAISYGEWFSSRLVALHTIAKRKYVWIHADMDKASFLHPDIMRYQELFDGFIFASQHSMDSALVKFPQLKGRSRVVHNQIDRAKLRQLSRQPVQLELPDDELPLLLTVANVREEKNHLRQVEAMRLLFDRGIRFRWLNIGSLAKADLVAKVRNAVADAGLEDYFLLPGPLENPYAVMCHANAVCVLSDHESWSMVITEAKQLGVPVLATETSGALEQIQNGKNGLLCGFSAVEIADCVERFLTSKALQSQLRKAGQEDACKDDTLHAITSVLSETKKKVLYAFDDLNYISGARNAALAQAKMVSGLCQADLFSLEPCRDGRLSEQHHILSMSACGALRALSKPIRDVLRSPSISVREKLLRGIYAASARLGHEELVPNLLLKRELSATFEGYDTIFVVSEASKLRKFVSERSNPGKVQWIHTDYAAWRERSPWTRAITKHDGELYRHYDTIVCLNQTLRQKFISIYPQFADKTIAVPNPIPREEILRRAAEPLTVTLDHTKFNLITIGRFEREKRYDRLLEIAAELKRQKFNFCWYFVGNGALYDAITAQRDRMELQREVVLTGALKNPCPLLKRCSLMVLFSEYEGTPVTIDEAGVLGVPVLANDVGGVREQIKENGIVFQDTGYQEVSDLIVKQSHNK